MKSWNTPGQCLEFDFVAQDMRKAGICHPLGNSQNSIKNSALLLAASFPKHVRVRIISTVPDMKNPQRTTPRRKIDQVHIRPLYDDKLGQFQVIHH